MAAGGTPPTPDAASVSAGARSSLARRLADASLALVVVLVVGMMIVPLPTPLLDVLIAGNVSIAVLLLLVAAYAPDALSLSSFPTILLVTTLFRLALNVSSTRLILLQADAGDVIRAFGEFVVQGDYVVGAVVFLILTLIQFVVIARGSERVAEVGARFTLDALPGKQMAIDAELRSGAIAQDEARLRRRALARESQFYGAMDGAMKFVKGDAIAGVVITAVNLVFGLAIGVGMRDLSAAESLRTYGLLTIGDGLVSQIPSLLISTAAGLVVTRVASEDEASSLGGDVGRQIFGNPRALVIAAAFLAALAVVPGLPSLPFLLLAGTFGAVGWRLSRSGVATEGPSSGDERARRRARERAEHAAARAIAVTPLAIELGAALAARAGAPPEGSGAGATTALERALPALGLALSSSLGVAVPEARVRASDALPDLGYAIFLREVPIARGEADDVASLVRGIERALRRRAADLVGVQETQAMLDALEREAPALVRHVVPKPIALPTLAEVLRRLVAEGVSIRPLREILEALALEAPTGERAEDAGTLAESVRAALRDRITYALAAPDGALDAHLVDPEIEEAIREAIARSPAGGRGARSAPPALPPALARDVLASVARAVAHDAASDADAGSRPPVLVTRPDVRRHLRRLVEVEHAGVVVLSYAELDPAVRLRPRAPVSL